ncbi:MAG: hypothetical protein SH809_01620 [Rhodothermales bacterium]|nr:hypothetical protein [Rhodothermales bacterium]
MISRPQNWQLVLTRLRVVDAQEDRSFLGVPLSNGDEPYIVIFSYRSRFGRSGTTEVTVNRYENSDWSGGLRAAQTATIPGDMGIMRFDGVESDEVIGFVAIAFESDRSPWAVMRNRVKEVTEYVRTNVARSVEERRTPSFETSNFIDELHLALHDAVVPLRQPLVTGKAIENVVFSAGDTDEMIGVNSAIFMRSAPTEAYSLPHYRNGFLSDQLSNTTFDLEGRALIFESTEMEARYDVELQVGQF